MSSENEKSKYFGNLEVKLLETREIDINFVNVKVEFTPKLSEMKKHHSTSHQFSDIFHFNVSRPDAEINVVAWRKNIIMKDKIQGTLTIPLSSLLDEQVHTGWYPLIKPTNKTVEQPVAPGQEKEKPTSPSSEEEDAGEGRKRSQSLSAGSSKKKPTGEIRLELKFTKNAPPKEILTGIILQDQWTSETAGGSLINNRKWVKNPQFLLNVDNMSDVTIKLRQPEDSSQRVSFYVVHYDEFYNGRRKVVLDANEIVKIDNFFCPIAAISVDSTMALEAGRYLIIPFAETPGYTGAFTVAVSGRNMDDLDLYKLPKDPSVDWIPLSAEGSWTEETAGGGDILGLNWRKNPQYHLILTQPSDISVVIEQEENTLSIGLYVVKVVDLGKRVVDYSDEVGKTDSFKYLCSTGLKISNASAGEYAIIPCTFDADILGKFQLVAYTTDPNATLNLSTGAWKHSQELKGVWEEGTAGGSPNNATFTKNPQFFISFEDSDQPIPVLLQLVQESAHYEEASIGFLVVKAKNGEKKRLTDAEPITAEDIFCKPDGWVPKVDVVCRTVIPPELKERNFILIPSTFKPDTLRSFHLDVHSDGPFTLEALL